MTQYSQRSWRLFGVFSFVVRKVRNSTARKLKRRRKRKRRGKGREEKTVRKTAFSLRRRRIPSPPLPNYRPLYSERSLRASSLIEPRAELRKGLSLPQPRFRVSFRVPLASLLFTISPKWRACSQAITCDPRHWLSMGCFTIFGGEFWRFKKRFQTLSKGGALVWALDCNQSGPRLLGVPWG